MKSALASINYMRDSRFEERGHMKSLAVEWKHLDDRARRYDLAQADDGTAAKRHKAALSISESTPSNPATSTTAEELTAASATPDELDPLEAIESTLLQSFLPADLISMERGNAVVGFTFGDPLTPFKKLAHRVDPAVPHSYLLSVEDVLYVYTVASCAGGIAHLKLAYQATGDALPAIVLLEDPVLDDCLCVTQRAILAFDLDTLIRGEGGTAWGISTPVTAACYPEPGTKASSNDTGSGANSVVSGFHEASGPSPGNLAQRYLPRPSTPTNISSSIPGDSRDAMSAFFTGMGQNLASSITPHSVQVMTREAEKSRILLFRLTGSRDNVFALLSSAGDATKHSGSFTSDLLDSFISNVGGTDSGDFLKIPFARDGKAIQGLLLGKVPDGFSTVQWDRKLPYGSARICFAHFLPAFETEAKRGMPYIPTTPEKYALMFRNMSTAFSGLFDKALYKADTGMLYSTRTFWQGIFSDLTKICYETAAAYNIFNVVEYRLHRHIQEWLHSTVELLARSDNDINKHVKGAMEDYPNDPDDPDIFTDAWQSAVGKEVNRVFCDYWHVEVVRRLVQEHRKGDFHTTEMSAQSIERTVKELVCESSMPAPKGKAPKPGAPTGSTANAGASTTSAKSGGSGKRPWGGGGYNRPYQSQQGQYTQQQPIGQGHGTPQQFFTGPTSMSASVLTHGSSARGPALVRAGPRGPAPACLNHLLWLFRPASSNHCTPPTGTTCQRLHFAMPTTDALKLDLITQQMDIFKAQTDVNIRGEPNRLKGVALAFLGDVHSEIQARLALGGKTG